MLVESLTDTSYTAAGLSSWVTYQFQVEARNAMGFSELTASLTILCAYIPESPVTPETAISTNTVVVTWIAPDANGSPITEYTILFRNSVDEFILELGDCDGRDETIVANT